MREVSAHLNGAERSTLQCQGGLYGLWTAATFAGPVSYGLVYHHNSIFMALAGILISIHVVCIPIWRRRLKRLLCASAWAREHGFTPERI